MCINQHVDPTEDEGLDKITEREGVQRKLWGFCRQPESIDNKSRASKVENQNGQINSACFVLDQSCIQYRSILPSCQRKRGFVGLRNRKVDSKLGEGFLGLIGKEGGLFLVKL